MLRYLVNLVFTLSKNSYTSSGWYRKYSDGWIEQGGYVAGVLDRHASATFTFLQAYSTAPVITYISCIPFGSSRDIYIDKNGTFYDTANGLGRAVLQTTTTTFTIYQNGGSAEDDYFAMGVYFVVCGK